MAARPKPDFSLPRTIGLPIALCAAVFLAAIYSLSFPPVAPSISSFWLPNGLALAALLRTPQLQWPALIAAAILGNVAAGYYDGHDALLVTARSLVSALQYGACAWVLRRRFGGYFNVLEPMQLAWLGAVGMITTILKIMLLVGLSDFFHSAVVLDRAVVAAWVLTNFLGLFVLALPVLAISSRSAIHVARIDWSGIGLLVLLFASLVVIFGPPAFPGLYMVMPLLMLIAWRHGLLGAGIATLLIVLVISGFAQIGGGLQQRLIAAGYSAAQRGTFMELFFTVAILTSLPLAVARTRQHTTDQALAEALAEAEERAAQLAESEAAARASEAALLTSENRWRAALEASGLGVWDWNRPAKTVYFSKRWKAMRGYADDEIGNSRSEWEDQIHPDDIAAVLDTAAAHVDGATPLFVSEYRIRCKDGSYKWVLDRGMAIERGEDDKPSRIIGTNTDIDAMKQASLRADRHAQLYRALAACNAALAGRGSADQMFGRICEILVASAGMKLVWVGMADEATGLFNPVAACSADQGLHYRVHAEVSSRSDDPRGQGMMGEAFRQDQPFWVDDFVSEGRVMWSSQRALERGWRGAAALPLRRKGRPVAVLSMYTDAIGFFDDNARALLSDMASQISLALDATEAEDSARAFQESLATSERRFRSMIETAPLGIALMDTVDGYFLTVNPMFETIVGWSTAELMEKTWQEITHPEDLGADWELAQQFIAGHIPGYQFEKRYLRSDGKPVWVNMTISRFSVPGSAGEQHLCMIEDITERRALESQVHFAQRMDAIGQLTGGVAHDFNNLLTIVIGSSEALIEQLDNPQQQKLAELILQAAEHGGELTRQLLAFARRQPLAPQPFDINELLASMAPLIKRTLGANLQFSIETTEKRLAAFADPSQTEAALLNLCLNARDAMPDGGRLNIATAMISLPDDQFRRQNDIPPGNYVEIKVSDTGTGIPPELRDRIFEPFFTTKGPGRGTGLGLSMVYGFIQQSHGWLDLSSEPGEGTVFTLYLPVADADADMIELPGDPAGAVEGGSENVLIVEDNDLVREHARNQFESLGYHVTVASNGAEALDILEHQQDIDLLFTDIVMPGGINGRALGQQALERWPSLRVLYTSGYSEDALSEDGRLLDDVTLLSKPYSKRELSEKARKVLDEVP
jgi:PAS domain S-box-containing protein